MKVQSKIFKGIEYVQVNLLPADQRNSIEQNVNPSVFIKILMEGKVVSNCLQYKDYEAWYDSIFRPVAKQPARKTTDDTPVALEEA